MNHFEVYRNNELIGDFPTEIEAIEFANADAEIEDDGKIKWTKMDGSTDG